MSEKQLVLDYLAGKPVDEAPKMFFTMNPGIGGIISLELPACERAMGGTGYDVFGVHWTAAATASHYTPGQAPRYTDIESWRDELKFPDINKLDWDSFKKDYEAVDTDKFVVAVTCLMGPFERTTCLTNFEDCLVNLISDPEDFADLIGAITDYKIALLEKAFSIAKIDVVNLHDDWGTNNSTFMNPELWRQVIRPHTQRLYDCVKAHGAYICQHSCGSIAPLVGDMIEMGARLWEAQADCNDIAGLREKYGKDLIILAATTDFPEMAPPVEEGAPAELPDFPPPKYPEYSEMPEFLFS